MMQKAISLPFKVDQYGTVSSTTDYKKIWSDRVVSVLGTMARQRVMHPFFGTTIPENLFLDVTSFEAVARSEVETAFSTYLPLLLLYNVSFQVIDSSEVSITVEYALPNETTQSTTMGLAVSSPHSGIQEII